MNINTKDKDSRQQLLMLLEANIYKANVEMGVAKMIGDFIKVKKQKQRIEALEKGYKKIKDIK